MSKSGELLRERKRIQDELEGRTLLRVDYSKLKQDDASYLPTGIFFIQAGWYRDEPFHCRDCGRLQIWTATQQKWCYEVLKASVHTSANRCRECRRKQREKTAIQKARTEAGYAKKKGSS